MKQRTSRSTANRHLSIAALTWLVSLLGGAAVGVALPRFGYSSDLAVVLAWAINLVTAYHLAKAATAQGRRGWVYGVLAGGWLMPAMAVYSFLKLSEMLKPSHQRAG